MDLLFIIWNFYLLYRRSIYYNYGTSIYYMELLFIIWNFYLLYGTSIYYMELLFIIWTFYLYMDLLFIIIDVLLIISPFIINAQHFRPPTYCFTFLLFITQWHLTLTAPHRKLVGVHSKQLIN